eukprot:Gb_02024 [translate_table: standard]
MLLLCGERWKEQWVPRYVMWLTSAHLHGVSSVSIGRTSEKTEEMTPAKQRTNKHAQRQPAAVHVATVVSHNKGNMHWTIAEIDYHLELPSCGLHPFWVYALQVPISYVVSRVSVERISERAEEWSSTTGEQTFNNEEDNHKDTHGPVYLHP